MKVTIAYKFGPAKAFIGSSSAPYFILTLDRLHTIFVCAIAGKKVRIVNVLKKHIQLLRLGENEVTTELTNGQVLLASLPAVDEILKTEKGVLWQQSFARRYVIRSIRDVIERYRQAILTREIKEFSLEKMLADIQTLLEKISEFSLKPVINATGVVIHTNLGRSVLSEEILENVKTIACGY